MKQKSKKTTLKIVAPSVPPSHFRMIDVGNKRVTRRRAVAEGVIVVGRAAYKKIQEKTLPKGDVLALAEIAGLLGAKKTPDLLPMCHPLPIDQALVTCQLKAPDAVVVYAQVTARATTGVEMEAIMAVQAGLAAIWDLVKGVEPALTIQGVRLLLKEGGKNGRWINPDGIPPWLMNQLPDAMSFKGLKAAVIVMSDRAAKGIYADQSGRVLQEKLQAAGAAVSGVTILPDQVDLLMAHIKKITQKRAPDIIFISGGTGLSKRDITPETLEKICDRMVPSLGDLLRQDGAQVTPKSWLSRSTAGVLNETLIIALPGSPKAVAEGFDALAAVVPHAVHVLKGGSRHD